MLSNVVWTAVKELLFSSCVLLDTTSTVVPCYYADSDITRPVVDPDFLPPGENAKWACLKLRIALTILKKR